jgi:hypothetical protein
MSSRSSVLAGDIALRVSFGLTLAFTHGLNKIKAPEQFLANVAQRGFPRRRCSAGSRS